MTRDTYNVGQAGAVGPGSQASNMSFNQTNLDVDIDFQAMTSEIRELRLAMQAGTDGELADQVVLGDLAAAEMAAYQGDGSAMRKRLHAAGARAMAFIEKAAVPVVSELMKRLLISGS